MPKVNTLFKFLQLIEYSEYPFSFERTKNKENIDVFIHQPVMRPQTFYLNSIPFECVSHAIEVYPTEIYNKIFNENEFSYFKYSLIIKNSVFDRVQRIEILMTEQGFIHEIYIYSSNEEEQLGYKNLPRHELDELVVASEEIMRSFYQQIHQSQQSYTQQLCVKWEEQVTQLRKMLFTDEEGSILEQMFEFYETLSALNHLMPSDYHFLYQRLTLIRHLMFSQPSNTMDNSSENRVSSLPEIEKIRSLSEQNQHKSTRLNTGEVVFNRDYLLQISQIIALSEDVLRTLFSDDERCPIEQFIHVIDYCHVQIRVKQILLDFLKSQVILKDYSFFKTTLGFCGHRAPMALADMLIQQNRLNELKALIHHIKPTYPMIHQLVIKIIQNNHVECFFEINQLYPIDFLQPGPDRKPMASLVFNLPYEHEIRSFLIQEHRQFRTISFYNRLLEQLKNLPWHDIKDDLALIRRIVSKSQQPSSSSLSMFQQNYHIDQALKEKLLFHRMMQEELKNRIIQHMSVDSAFSQVVMKIVYTQVKQFKKLVMLAEQHVILPLFDRFNEASKNLNQLLTISGALRDKRPGFSRTAKRQSKNLQHQFNELLEKTIRDSDFITQQTNQTLAGVNQALLSDLYDMLECLEEYRIVQDPEMFDKLQHNLRTIKEKYGTISEQDNHLVSEIFFLPYHELLNSIELEINEFVSAARVTI
jgi:hypothetical protein